MFKLIGRLLVVLAFGWAGSASAAMMPPVQVNDQQWLQPIDFLNNSWSDIASVCNSGTGVCNGLLGGNDLTGWNWAGVPDLNTLFTAFDIPGFTGSEPTGTFDSTASSTWAPAFLASFVNTGYFGFNAVGGILRDPFNPDLPNSPTVGVVANDVQFLNFPTIDVASSIDSMDNVDSRDPGVGGWFYREAPSPEVPSPATLPLLGLALAALGYSRRKRKQYA